MTVVAAQVSVSPYPCKTGQHNVVFKDLCVSGARGAPPDKTNLRRPPSNARIGLNNVLYKTNNFSFNRIIKYLSLILRIDDGSFISSFSPFTLVLHSQIEKDFSHGRTSFYFFLNAFVNTIKN